MIFSTITQNNLNLTADTTEIPAQYSNNIRFKFIQDNERFSGYIPTIYIGVYDSAMIECGDVISAGGAVVVDGDGVFAISNEIMYRNGFLAVGVTLTNNDENVSLKPVIYRIQASIGGLSPLPPDEGEWQQVVKAFVETLFNNWSTENLDPIKAQLEELISTAQTQQEKITSQQTQIDNAIGNMGDYEIVQEDPVQIRFKKGDGTFGETVDLGDGLASKAMVNAGYYTYKGISYGGSASNNGIDAAEIDGAYSQETTNGFQLFDASKLPTKSQGGATVTNNGDGSFTISGSGNLTETFSLVYQYSHEETLKLLKVGDINLVNGNSTKPFVLVQLVKSGGTSTWFVLNKDISKATITQEMLDDINCVLQIYIFGESGAIQTGTIKPMLYQDGYGTWEPFTGGIASPNPKYPQDPKFVGDYNEDTQKYNIDFMTSGKNLFDNKAIQRTWQCDYISKDDGSIEITPTATTGVSYIASEVIELRVGETYSLQSFENNEYFKNMVIWKANTTITAYKTQELFTVEEGNNLIQIGIYINNGSLSNKASLKPQLSLGEPKSEFVPFTGFETTTVELNQPLRELPNGVKDTIENGVVTRRVGEITFNGSETWLKNAGNTNNWLYHIAITHVNAKGLCDSLPHNEIDVINSDGSGINRVGFNFTQYEKVMYLNVGYYMEQAGLTNTVDNLKTWLQSNPITVWYELATPTTEQITLPTLPSWYPYTDAWVGTELQPSFVEWHIKTAGANQNDLTVIKEDISQLQTETTQLNDDVTMLMGAFTSVTDLTKQLFLLMHRVGDIIFSTSDENPSTIYGGTWVAWGKGQVPVGVDTSDSDFNTVEKTGGEKEHTLTVDEMPSHKHDFGQQFAATSNLSGAYGYYMIAGTQTDVIKNTGGNQPHNNLQPYITCYMWKRTA
ncbi:phage baseplate protein [Thomasclavelia ramosa]|uniref:phage baseplate protein n=4 Tax=Bacillati TaxID=1783272 RepID=UPI001D069826|nr:hypothetical protein [Thomasclavelia ramosa]MCB6436524.1 hypothetical protein [Thomasclavelia ramosa]MCB6459582.1 hypothetical protein [Thomasclavelia ramosa]MCB6601432.1 hypothetical protein [Thomasclavelia ramosa]MCB6619934.1 hypothetical protein [Thomasclavelia ramosa]MCQ5307256.1 hypothetical protein [Thomasclavelia ramosa]